MNVPATHRLVRVINGEKCLCVSYSQIETFLQCPYKWYKMYVEGKRSTEKQEATSYGSVIHQTLEYFFKNKCVPSSHDLSTAYNYYAAHEEIPFSSAESMLKAGKDAVELINWISDLFRKNENGEFIRKIEELNPFEKLLRSSSAIGIEENFCLPYKLQKPVNINGDVFTHVVINGSIDLHLVITVKGVNYHYVVDWKSGNKVFENKKLKTNLQHPIYSFYVMRKYGEGLPRKCLYFFTRMREYQEVTVDDERKNISIKELNDAFSKMYNFEDRPVQKFLGFFEREKEDGTKGYAYKYCTLRKPLPENMKPCPSALCYYCDFSKHKNNECPYSSDWDPSKKKEK